MKFKHSGKANKDARIMKLIYILGYDGYGLYWALIELLMASPSYTLRIADIPKIATSLHVRAKTIKRIIFDFDLFETLENGNEFRSIAKGLHTLPRK